MSNSPPTAIIVDLACNTQLGHTPASMEIFGGFLEEAGYRILCVLPRGSDNVRLHLSAQLRRDAPAPYGPAGEGLGFALPRWIEVLAAAKTLAGGKSIVGGHFERLVIRGYWLRRMVIETASYFSRLLIELKAGYDDIVVMPSADLCTTMGLLQALRRYGPSAPRLALRFISVLENVGPMGSRSANSMWNAICSARRDGLRVECGFETERYRRSLPADVQATGRLVPYPPSKLADGAIASELLSSGRLVIGVLGSARPEKGFDKLPALAALARARFGPTVCFTVQQAARPWGDAYTRVCAELTAACNVSLLPGQLHQHELRAAMHNCDVLLLPYSPNVYALRGSAMVFDACDLAMPCIVRRGTAFAVDLERDQIGLAYETDAQFAASCERLLGPGLRLEYSQRLLAYNQHRRAAVMGWLGH